MFRHYLKQSLRVLKKQRLYATINIIGLSIGLCLATLIFLFVRDEFTFDHWQEKADQIYSVQRVSFRADGSESSYGLSLPFPLGEALVRDHPGIEETVRMMDNSVVVRIGDLSTSETVLFVDRNFLQVFSHEVVRGDMQTALDDPTSIVLTMSSALKHFGTIDVVGKQFDVRFDGTFEPTVVTAVVRDPPTNTNIPFEYLLPFHRTPLVYRWVAGRVDGWNQSSFDLFAVLNSQVELAAAQSTLASLWKTYYPDRGDMLRERGVWEGSGEPSSYRFVPLKDLHLDTAVPGSFVATSDKRYSMILIAIGLTILGLACINFIILTIGRGATRAGEIGVRKALGARRGQIMAQFGSESMLLTAVALGLGLLMAILLLPLFNTLSGKGLDINPVRDLPLLVALLCVAVITGGLAGWYPSLVISRHRAADTLRGRVRLGGSNTLTKTLVVGQFVASIALVAGALVMHQQMKHLQNRDLGYNPENVLVIHGNRTDGRELAQHLDRSIGQRADVTSIGSMSFTIDRGSSHEAWNFRGQEYMAYVYNIEPETAQILDPQIVAGRLFDDSLVSDTTYGVLINEALAAMLGYQPEEAVGMSIDGYDSPAPRIVGVIKDLNFQSLHVEVEPMMLTMSDNERMRYALVKTNTRDVSSLLAAAEKSWAAFAPGIPFSYSFMDDDVARMYRNDQRWSSIVNYAAGIAILIACMGLFGLAALTIARRTKEIGVRKVLGASISSVLVLVTKDFAKLVAIATLIGGPIAYFALHRWLEGFAYRVQLSPWVFAVAGGAVLVTALCTVAFHSVRVALSNPVDALRYE